MGREGRGALDFHSTSFNTGNETYGNVRGRGPFPNRTTILDKGEPLSIH